MTMTERISVTSEIAGLPEELTARMRQAFAAATEALPEGISDYDYFTHYGRAHRTLADAYREIHLAAPDHSVLFGIALDGYVYRDERARWCEQAATEAAQREARRATNNPTSEGR